MSLKSFRSGFTVKLRKEKQPSKTTSGQDCIDKDCYRETTKLRKHAVVGELEDTKMAISTYEKSSRYLRFPSLSFSFLIIGSRIEITIVPTRLEFPFFPQIEGAHKARNFAK